MTPRRRLALVALAFLGFASLGLPDGAVGVAWPRVREDFGLPLDALGALLVATTTGYVTASFLTGWLLARMSVGALLALSAALTGATLVAYAASPCFAAMVAAGVASGLGAGAIDAGINGFAAVYFPARVLHWLHAAYGIGTTSGPALMTFSLMSGAGWRRGYLWLGAVQLALAAAFAACLRLWPAPAREGAASAGEPEPLARTLRLPAARLGALAFFLYLGVEATAGAWLYSLLEEGRGAPMGVAGSAVSLYWGGLLAGRIAFGFAPGGWRPDALVRAAVIGCASSASVVALDLGTPATLAGASLLGFAAAPIFPALIAGTPARVGASHAGNAVGIQVAAAALGQAGLPAAVGWVAARAGLEWVPVALLGFSAGLLGVHGRLARTPSAPLSAAPAH